MRKIAFLAAAAAAVCTVACNKEVPTEKVEMPTQAVETAQLRLSIKGSAPETKAWEEDFDEKHSAVASVQFFVFDGETLDAYKKITGGLSADMTVKTGTKTVWAVVNAPDISNVTTLTQLKAVNTTLMDNATNFVMVGSVSAVVPSDDPIEIAVKRIVSRVVVKKVTAAFTNPAYASMDCKLEKMYLINIAANTNLALTAAPTDWYCKRVEGAVAGLANHIGTSIGRSIKMDAYTIASTHYAYPNPTVEDSQATTWSARHTRIVLEVTLGSERFYYPITLPVLEPGKSYEIENVTITRKGSTSPDQPVSLSDATFEIKVSDWTVVPVTDGITI